MPGFELINKEEKKAVSSLFDEGGILFAHGFEKQRKKFHVREFEKKFSKFIGSKYALAVSSGTAAIKIALKALGVKSGDEVITQSFNFIATVEAILDIGAKPIIANVNDTLNIDPNDLIKKITSKTKVVIPVHMLGYSCEMDEINSICKKYKIKVLEDNCESLGAKFKKRMLGNLSEIGVFSLDFGKTITTGEGGIITTNNKKYYNFCKEFHDHGHKNIAGIPRGLDKVSNTGFNYRMTDIQGCIGKVQLSKINKLLQDNKRKYSVLSLNIKNFKHRVLPKNSKPNYDTFIFFVEKNYQKKKILKILNKYKVNTKNLPDAIKWHCSAYWKHIFSSQELAKVKETKRILEKSISIPIFYKIKLQTYKKISFEINKI